MGVLFMKRQLAAARGVTLCTLPELWCQYYTICHDMLPSSPSKYGVYTVHGAHAVRNLPPLGVGHEDSISMGCLDGAGRRLLTVAFDKTARVWDIRSGRCLAVLQHHQRLVRGCMAPHGHTVVTVTADHVAHLWDVRSGQALHAFQVSNQFCGL